MNETKMRLVGNRHWREFAASPQEALERGVRLDAMTRLPGVPDFQPRGIFRGTQAYFDAMDAEKEHKRQIWFQENTKCIVVDRGNDMGITYTDITVENLFKQRQLAVKSLVDSGSVFFTLPEHIALQLGFDTSEVSTREIIPADGSRKSVPMIGPLRVYFADRYCDLSALVMGDEPLFGAVPMEMMDLVLHPATQTLTVNPDSPFVPVALAK